jgi:hypothetical protein
MQDETAMPRPSTSPAMSRRQLLEIAGVSIGSAVIAGCSEPVSLAADPSLSSDFVPLAEAYHCMYDRTTKRITYTVEGAPANTTITVTAASVNPTKTGAPPDLVTNANGTDSKTVGVECTDNGNTGTVTLTFTRGIIVSTCTLCFECAGRGAKATQIRCGAGAQAKT